MALTALAGVRTPEVEAYAKHLIDEVVRDKMRTAYNQVMKKETANELRAY
jgi:hypothetical protein